MLRHFETKLVWSRYFEPAHLLLSRTNMSGTGWEDLARAKEQVYRLVDALGAPAGSPLARTAQNTPAVLCII